MTVVSEHHKSIYVEYLCVTDWKKDAVTLQDGKTIDFMWVSRDELIGMQDNQLATSRIQKFVDELR